MTLDQQLELEDLLHDAFAPLRQRGTAVSAARIRASVRWAPRPTAPGGARRGFALFSRVAQASLALGVSAFIFVGAVGMPRSDSEPEGALTDDGSRVRVSTPVDDGQFFRWVRIGRSGRVSDEIAADAGAGQTAVQPETALASRAERQGLVR